MPVFKDVFNRRMVSCALITVFIALLFLSGGAVLIVTGLLSPQSAWYWVCMIWILSVFLGSRISIKEKRKTLLRSLLNAAAAMLVLLLMGITDDGKMSMQRMIICGGCAFSGAVLAALFPQRKRRKERRKVR